MSTQLVTVTPTLSLSPTTPMREWNVIVAQAEILAQSDIVPKAYQRRPQNIIAAAIAGRAHGWDAMTSMLNGHVIEGKYGVSPEAQLGLIRGAGHSVTKIAEVRGESVTVRGTRTDSGDTLEVTWTLEDAKKAKLSGKSNWQTYPAAMLWARAVSELSTQLFSDVTLGLARYTAEELGDDDEDGALPARVNPPPGWESWEECDEAHDAYIAKWRGADEHVRSVLTGYARSSGYERPMTRDQLTELDAELDVQIAAPAHRERPEAPAEDESKVAAFDAETRDDLATAEPPPDDDVIDVEEAKPKRQRKTKAAPEAAETPGAPEPSKDATTSVEGAAPASPGPDGDGDGADGGNTEPSAENATAGDDPSALPEGPTPAVAPTPSDKGQHARLATGLKRIWDAPDDATARALLVSIITKGRTKSSRETTSEECLLAIEASKLIERGQLVFAVSDNGKVEPITHTALNAAPGLPEPTQLATLVAAIPEGGDAEAGNAFIRKVAEHQAAQA